VAGSDRTNGVPEPPAVAPAAASTRKKSPGLATGAEAVSFRRRKKIQRETIGS
jgi:hypothetical protein